MKHLIKIIFLFLVTISLTGNASAGTQVFKFNGAFGHGSFTNIDSSGCIKTDVSIFGGTGSNQNIPAPPENNQIALEIIEQVDTCKNLALIDAICISIGQ